MIRFRKHLRQLTRTAETNMKQPQEITELNAVELAVKRIAK